MEKRTKMIVYRKHLELTQCELAGMIGVTHQAISRWENGLGFPRPAIAIRLADALGTTVEDLFGKRGDTMENKIGNRIRERRLELGMSQGRLARKMGTDQSQISYWEAGRCEPKVFTAICLAKALETTVEELFAP